MSLFQSSRSICGDGKIRKYFNIFSCMQLTKKSILIKSSVDAGGTIKHKSSIGKVDNSTMIQKCLQFWDPQSQVRKSKICQSLDKRPPIFEIYSTSRRGPRKRNKCIIECIKCLTTFRSVQHSKYDIIKCTLEIFFQ